MERISEPEAGITAFLSPGVAGFEGKFKERWQDFHVHEIDATGTELHLSELITPGLVASELKSASDARRRARLALGPSFSPPPEVEARLREALGGASAEILLNFLRSQRPAKTPADEPPPTPTAGVDAAASTAGSADVGAAADAGGGCSGPPAFVDLDASSLGDGSKEARKIAHRAILEAFESLLSTETVETDGTRQVRVWMKDAEARVKSRVLAASAQSDDRKEKKGKGKGKKGKGKGKGKKGKPEACESTVEPSAVSEFGTLRREGWPKDRPKYLHFRLYKENCNTSEAISSIANIVGRSPKQFACAGTKDRRAATVQLVSAKRLPIDQLRRSLTHRSWDRRLRVSDLTYMPEQLRLGQLRGNRFNIVLRGVAPDAIAQTEDSVLARAFAAATAHGFLNYFGLQRFGTREVRTHCVGAAVLSTDYTRVARLILGEWTPTRNDTCTNDDVPLEDSGIHDVLGKRKAEADHADAALAAQKIARTKDGAQADDVSSNLDGERKERQVPKWRQIKEAASHYLVEGDAKAALQAMPKSQHLERCILGAIDRGLRGEEILRQLPHQALSLYVHAAQSIVWNAVLSKRIAKLGSKPVVGDLVLANKNSGDDVHLAGVEDVLEGDGCEVAEEEQDDGSDEEEETRVAQLPAVRELTDADVGDCASLSDVVLPLPGYGVRYPERLRPYYEESARELLGIELETFHDSKLVPLRGAYRAAAVRPADLSWKALTPEEVVRAEADRKPLQQTDVARLLDARGEVPGEAVAPDATEDVPASDAHAPHSLDNAGRKGMAAVAFSCVLPPSAYLTMLLREVTKLSTASPLLLG